MIFDIYFKKNMAKSIKKKMVLGHRRSRKSTLRTEKIIKKNQDVLKNINS
jgi:hypothetical protein